jgi:hypothetical protein
MFGKKSDHPLTDIKSAQQFLEDIPKNDPIKLIQELSESIEFVREHANDFRLEQQWAVLRMFDQAAQPHVRKLLNDYFSAQPLSRFQENRLWTLLDYFYTQSDLCHHDIWVRYRDGVKGATAIKAELPYVFARGISTITGRLKLIAAHYALVEPPVWKRLAEYYREAETQGFHNNPVAIYTGVYTSVAQEFAELVAWYGFSSGNLNPLQEHICERMFSFLGKGLRIVRSYKGVALFVFDTAQPTPPMRASAEGTIHPALRFIDEQGVRQELDGLIKNLDKGIIPDSLNLYGAKYDVELLRDIARRMMQSLSSPPPSRRNPRRKIRVNLKVANGFNKILEQSDAGLNFDAEESETWEVEDISTTGFRSVVPLARAEGVKIGLLVGSKPESVSHWGAGVVRRLSRDADGNLHIGVEMLSSWIIGVPLVDRSQSGVESYLIGLYLNRPADTSGEAWLLMKPETFSTNHSLTMQLFDKDYLLLPLGLVESGDDYDLARYRKMEQDVGGEE